MKRLSVIAIGLVALGVAGDPPAVAIPQAVAQSTATPAAEVQTVTLAIENMTCALCPVTVSKALEGVEGVRSVEVDFDAKTATVVFDPSVATIKAIAAASTNAGYPAKRLS